MTNIVHFYYHVSTFLCEDAIFSKFPSFFLPFHLHYYFLLFVDLAKFQTLLPVSTLPLQYHLDIFRDYYSFCFHFGMILPLLVARWNYAR